MQACLLIYDIPEESELENPSGRLRRIAVRVNLSCWVIREGDIPYNYLNVLRQGGATWHVVKFDTSENHKLIKMAIEALKKDIKEVISRAKASAMSACGKLNDPSLVPEDARKRYDAQTKATVKRMKQTLSDLKEASKVFGITDRDLNLDEAHQQARIIQNQMQERAREFNKRINELAAIRGNNDGVVRAARADRMPIQIFADYAEENGVDMSKFRNLFR